MPRKSERRIKTVVVIGAGIVGVSTCLWLQRAGHRVILIDRLGPAEGTSFGNGGVLASSALPPVTVPGILSKAPKMLLDPREPLFIKWSYVPRLFPWLFRYLSHSSASAARKRAEAIFPLVSDSLSDHQAVSRGTPAEKWVVPCDYLYLYADRSAFDHDSFGWSLREAHGIGWEVLEGEAIREYDPIFGPRIGLAAKMEGHGRISDPGRYVKDLADHACKEGARLLIAEAEAVVHEGGEVAGVRAGGETISCDAAVIATGAWSRRLMRPLGVDPHLESERGYHLELWEPSHMPRSPVLIASGKFVATPMEGRVRLAGIVEFGGLESPRSRAPFALLERQARAAMPGLRWKETLEWMGHRPSMADSVPVIGEIPGVKGAYAGFGHDHVGLTAGPATGRILAQLIDGSVPNLDLSAYSPSRFS